MAPLCEKNQVLVGAVKPVQLASQPVNVDTATGCGGRQITAWSSEREKQRYGGFCGAE